MKIAMDKTATMLQPARIVPSENTAKQSAQDRIKQMLAEHDRKMAAAHQQFIDEQNRLAMEQAERNAQLIQQQTIEMNQMLNNLFTF